MITEQKIFEYCLLHSTKENDLLVELRRETHLKTLSPKMLSGHIQASFLRLLVKLIQPAFCLEVGSFTSYASLYMAEGLPKNGKLISIEIEEEYRKFHNKYHQLSPYGSRIIQIYGDANKVIPTLDYKIDFSFLDARKSDYEDQYEMILGKTNKGGIIVADNVLWKGEVLEEKKGKMAQQLNGFNQKVTQDSRTENFILPIRDGLHIIRKL